MWLHLKRPALSKFQVNLLSLSESFDSGHKIAGLSVANSHLYCLNCSELAGLGAFNFCRPRDNFAQITGKEMLHAIRFETVEMWSLNNCSSYFRSSTPWSAQFMLSIKFYASRNCETIFRLVVAKSFWACNFSHSRTRPVMVQREITNLQLKTEQNELLKRCWEWVGLGYSVTLFRFNKNCESKLRFESRWLQMTPTSEWPNLFPPPIRFALCSWPIFSSPSLILRYIVCANCTDQKQ